MSTTPPVGADVESICGRCNEETWHVVVAKVGDTIAKVVCKACGAQHRYRPVGGLPKAKKAKAPRARATSSRASGGSRKRKPIQLPPPEEPFAIDPTMPMRRYKPLESFEPGEQITHSKFGPGRVEQILDLGKMEVRFADGRRVLTMGRSGPAPLERPRHRFDEDE